MRKITILLSLSVLLCLPICAQETAGKNSIRGLRGVVVRAGLEDDAGRFTTEKGMRDAIEAQLRGAGLNVGDDSDVKRKPFPPILMVIATERPAGAANTLITFRVVLYETGYLDRRGDEPLLVISWEHPCAAIVQTREQFSESLNIAVEWFTHQWQEANKR
jgi:hypothetical protein